MTYKVLAFIFTLFFIKSIAVAQTSEIDSLENVLINYYQTDTLKIDLLNDLAFKLLRVDKEKTLQYATLADSLSDVLDYLPGKPKSLKVKGMYYRDIFDFPQAINYFQKSIKISEALNDLATLASCNNAIAQIYMDQGDYPRSLEYYQTSLVICEKLGNEYFIAAVQSNLGGLYLKQKNYTEALRYYSSTVDFFEKSNKKTNLILAYQNIVTLYVELRNDSLALNYSDKLIALCKSEGNNYQLAHALISRGQIEQYHKNYDLAIQYYTEGISTTDKIGDVLGSFFSNYSLAHLYVEIGKYNLALGYALAANEKANKLGRLKEKSDVAGILAQIYKNINEYKKAYEYFELYKTRADSLLNESNIKEITNLENQYAFEKEKETIANEQAKKDVVQAEELKRQNIVRNSFIAGFLLMIVFALFIIRNLAQKRKANLLLAEQKEEIETQAEELKTTNEKLVELDEFKQGMTGMIVHDLKNPLNGILNVSKSYAPEKQVVRMKQTGKQMLNMVLNILDVNKFEDSQMTVNKMAVSLVQIANAAMSGIRFLAQQKNLTIHNTISPIIAVNADHEIIERIFINLLTNAIKYTPNNGEISLNAEIIGVEHKFAKISVSDTGEGIPQDKLHLVFEKFGQVSAKTSGNVQSTGLGLTFCKMAVEAHEGEIDVKSELNKGTTFWFTLQVTNDELVQQPENIILELKPEKVSLNAEEKKILAPYILQFKKTEIYKMLELRKKLRQITTDNVNILKWKDEIRIAIGSGNQERYDELLNI